MTEYIINVYGSGNKLTQQLKIYARDYEDAYAKAHDLVGHSNFTVASL